MKAKLSVVSLLLPQFVDVGAINVLRAPFLGKSNLTDLQSRVDAEFTPFVQFLAAEGASKEAPSFEEYLPKCLAHLKGLIKTLDETYTDVQLRAVLQHECGRNTLGSFEDEEACTDFADELFAAREKELGSNSTSGYPPLCKAFYERTTGEKVPSPKATLAPPTTAEPAAAAPAAPDAPTVPDAPAVPAGPAAPRKYTIGDDKCRCVGINGIEGSTLVKIEGREISYPADLGGHCAAWDHKLLPSCAVGAAPEEFCRLRWCFVDPCECDIAIAPRKSMNMPDFTFQGKPLFFSYTTCGNTWDYVPSENVQALADAKKTCDTPKDPFKVGFAQCRCVGIAGQSGSTLGVTSLGASFTLAADVGSSCEAWDEKTHPDCLGSGKKPAFCNKKWCYVDPCSCNLPDETPPSIATRLPGASFQNKPLYYSYATCMAGASDQFTPMHNPTACVLQKTQGACEAQASKCDWESTKCIGKELVGVC